MNMSQTLEDIAKKLEECGDRVQLIYAFNAVGKTRLSEKFKELIYKEEEKSHTKVLYYNAFTEDLFYWDNDIDNHIEPKLKIQENNFIKWVLDEHGLHQKISTYFQHYYKKITPIFNNSLTEVTFSLTKGDNETENNIKISKGQESNLIWSIFYVFLQQISEVLQETKEERSTEEFDHLEYVFIDDPVTSLDENHLIKLAVELAGVINNDENLKFIITTHNPLFYNVLYRELKSKKSYILKHDDESYVLDEVKGASNTAFSYHLHIKDIIEQAIKNKKVERYHFTLLRNLYEKTAAFLGYQRWGDLLDNLREEKSPYVRRIVNFSSHSDLSNEEIAEPTEEEKNIIQFLLTHLTANYGPWGAGKDK